MKCVETINVPVVAESLTLRWAMEKDERWGLSLICLEADCLRAVNEFHTLNPASPLFGLLEDVKVMASSMEGFSLAFSHRSYNATAHRLAKDFCSQEVSKWEGSCPYSICLLAKRDVQDADLS